MDSLAKLHEELQKAINSFDTESIRHRELYRKWKTRLIVLAAGTTIVAGAGLMLTDGSDRTIQFIVLGLAAATTAIITWLEMRRVREHWQRESQTYDALVDLQQEVDSCSVERALSEVEVAEYSRRVSAALGAHHDKKKVEKKEVEGDT